MVWTQTGQRTVDVGWFPITSECRILSVDIWKGLGNGLGNDCDFILFYQIGFIK